MCRKIENGSIFLSHVRLVSAYANKAERPNPGASKTQILYPLLNGTILDQGIPFDTFAKIVLRSDCADPTSNERKGCRNSNDHWMPLINRYRNCQDSKI